VIVFVCSDKTCPNYGIEYNMLETQQAECGGCGVILIGQPNSLSAPTIETIESN